MSPQMRGPCPSYQSLNIFPINLLDTLGHTGRGLCGQSLQDITHCGSLWALHCLLGYADLRMGKMWAEKQGIFMGGKIF